MLIGIFNHTNIHETILKKHGDGELVHYVKESYYVKSQKGWELEYIQYLNQFKGIVFFDTSYFLMKQLEREKVYCRILVPSQEYSYYFQQYHEKGFPQSDISSMREKFEVLINDIIISCSNSEYLYPLSDNKLEVLVDEFVSDYTKLQDKFRLNYNDNVF